MRRQTVQLHNIHLVYFFLKFIGKKTVNNMSTVKCEEVNSTIT